MMFDFSEDEIQRYSRHILLKEIGVEGQERIRQGRVLIVGAGGLGSPVLMYLAATGVGTIGVVDGDMVDASNLQRQIMHFTADIGRLKTQSAEAKAVAINPHVRVERHDAFLDADNAADIIARYDFVIDATDNFACKFLINDACVMAGKAFSHAGVLRFEGQAFTHIPGTACYRCLFSEPPEQGTVPTCSEAGVMGPVVGVIGSVQATEAIKYLTGAGRLLTNRLLTFNALEMQFRTVAIQRDPHCAVCGDNPTITTLEQYDTPACMTRTNGKGGQCQCETR